MNEGRIEERVLDRLLEDPHLQLARAVVALESDAKLLAQLAQIGHIAQRRCVDPGVIGEQRLLHAHTLERRREIVGAPLILDLATAVYGIGKAGTLICACALARVGIDATETKAARKRKVVAAIRETADQLGNTPAICRASYIYPAVLSDFERGRVIDQYFSTVEQLIARRAPGLHGSEKALVRLLKGSS